MEEKKRKLYIKERRAACDLIAKKNGRAARTPEDVQTVANMSDDDIIKLLTAAGFWDDTDADAVKEEKTPAAAPGPEKIQNKKASEKITTAAASPVDPEQTSDIIKLDAAAVEELRPDGAPLSGSDLYNAAENIINNYIIANNWDDKKITPTQWAACMLACGRAFRSGFRVEQVNSIARNNIKQIDAQAVADAVPVWLEICYKYDKTPLISCFCYFVSVSDEWLYKGLRGVTSGGVSVLALLKKTQENGLNYRILDDKKNSYGPIFLQKAINGYSETSIIKHETIKGADGSANLPDFGSFQALEDKNS